MSHLCPIGTNFNWPERQSSRTAKTVVDILSAVVGMSIRKSSFRLGGGELTADAELPLPMRMCFTAGLALVSQSSPLHLLNLF